MSPRNVDRDMQHRDQKISDILDSAVYTIAGKGIGATSMKDIAQAAGISIGNLYHYFKSKEELLDVLLKRSQQNYGELVRELERLDEPPLAKLARLTRDWLTVEENWALTMIRQNVRTSHLISHQIRRDVTDRFTDNLAPIASIMAEGQKRGEIKDGDPTQLAFYLVSLIQGLTLQKAPGYEVPVAVEAQSIVNLFVK
ncbi:TetR family transcriptional regulator [Paenibacillus oryzae]|uniref:TetR family transcriptional regulator n=1 Tax=Paenibacillus oryzae TaxID=1844972 RepID=A0A1A5YES8_9BACL|nr:TetR/AcrR family transcriptional regulator [Paenibacillus oryzae]OBR64146.1 TetR family transcriptional regulator [Paenibacillus oryzae]